MTRAPLAGLLVFAVAQGVIGFGQSRPMPGAAGGGVATVTGSIVRLHDGGPVRFAAVVVESAEGSVRRTAITDAAGHFTVVDIPPGRYGIRASATGYASGVWTEGGNRRIAAAMVVEANQRRTGIRVALARGGVITGRVVDADGAPVEGVPVHALIAEFHNSRELLRQVAARPRVTDDRGHFRLFGLEPADYYIAAIPGPFGDSPGGPLAGHPLAYFPGTSSVADATLIAVAADRESAIGDLVVRAAMTMTVSGRVIDSQGAPAAAAEMVLLPASGPASSVMPRATSDATGQFSFIDVPEGQYLLQNLPAPSSPSEFGSALVSVPGAVATVLHLKTGATRRGHVVFADTAPDFTARQLMLSLLAANRGQSPLSRGGRVKVHDDWSLEFTNVWGPHFVRLPEPPRGWMLSRVHVGADDFVDRPIDFSRAGTTPITVVLTRRGATVSGTVRDRDRAPAAGAHVVIFSSDTARWFQDERAIQWTRTDAEGRYLSRPLPAGDYLIVAVDDARVRDWPPRPAVLEAWKNEADSVSLAESGHRARDLLLTAYPQ
jgi:protocatechuate 3,4-dioxygenase beta subunit